MDTYAPPIDTTTPATAPLPHTLIGLMNDKADRLKYNVQSLPVTSVVLTGLAGIGLYAIISATGRLLGPRPVRVKVKDLTPR